MAGTTHVYVPILGKRIRITTLDVCGNVPAGGTVGSVLATSGFITVTLQADVEKGAEILQKKADGSLCVSEMLTSSFKRFNVDIDFCGVNPSIVGMVSNAKPYNDANNDVAGFTVGEGAITKKFALEIWTGLAGQACLPGTAEASGYLLLPFIQSGVPGDIVINGEKAVDFTLQGAYTKGGNTWGVGPYKPVMNATSVASALPTALAPTDHLLMIDTGVAPPPDAGTPTPMPPFNATGALAGIPGSFVPAGGTPPATFTQANTWVVTATPATAWTAGQYVQGSTAGATGEMNWTGTTWATGRHA